MKKRLLAGMVAVAIAATGAVGFTACGNNGAMTKEEWEKAWQDTAAVDSYTYIENLKGVSVSDHGGSSPYDYCREVRYDNVNKAIDIYEHGIYIPEWYEDGYTYEHYYEVVGNDILSYERYSADDEWESYTSLISFWDGFNYLASIASEKHALTITEDGYLDDMHTLEETYDYVVYNSKTKTYTLELYWATYEMQFKNGYLYKLNINGEAFGETFTREMTVTDINSTVVIVPEEVKNSVQNQPDNGDNENPEQPDDEDTGVTKEEWIKAWQDSAAADSFTLVEVGIRYRTDEDSQEVTSYDYYMEMEYDNVNKVVHSLGRINGQYSEFYYGIEGNIMYEYYRYSEDAQWEYEEGDVSYWAYINHYLEYIASWPYTVPDADDGVNGTIEELFDYAEYDSTTKTYTLNLITNDTDLATYEVQLSDGYLYKFTVNGDSFGQTLSEEITVTGVNSTSLSVPEDVKNSVR